MGRIVVLFGTEQKRLGRNTTYIKTCTAYRILLKEHHIFAGFARFLCSGIACRTASYDGKKIFTHILFLILISGFDCKTTELAGMS